MSLACFQAFLKKWKSDREKNYAPPPQIEICFHGGEPTLVGRPTIQKFIDQAKDVFGENTLRFSMQSNGVLLDKEWTQFFDQNKINIAVSLDGVIGRDNKHRKLNRKTISKIRLFLGTLAGAAGVLMVVTRQNIKSLYFNLIYFFIRYRIKNIRASIMEFVSSEVEVKDELSGADIEKLYRNLLYKLTFFPAFREAGTMNVLKNFFAGYLYTREKNENNDWPAFLCSAKFCASGNAIINLLPNGDLWACQRSLRLPKYKMGNIYDQEPDLFGIISFRKMHELALGMAKDIRKKRCDVCYAADICDYGCRAFALLKTQEKHAIREGLICACYKKLKQHLCKDVYNHLFLHALLNEYPIKKEKKVIYIEIPERLNTTSGQYKTRRIRDYAIQGELSRTGYAKIFFDAKKLNKRNLFWAWWVTQKHKKNAKEITK